MVIVILFASVVVLPLISLLFYRRGASLPPRQRLAASVHALLIGLIMPYGLVIDAFVPGQAHAAMQLPIFVCVVLGAASMLYSFWVFRSQPVLYLAHVVTVVVALPAVFLGAIAITGWT